MSMVVLLDRMTVQAPEFRARAHIMRWLVEDGRKLHQSMSGA